MKTVEEQIEETFLRWAQAMGYDLVGPGAREGLAPSFRAMLSDCVRSMLAEKDKQIGRLHDAVRQLHAHIGAFGWGCSPTARGEWDRVMEMAEAVLVETPADVSCLFLALQTVADAAETLYAAVMDGKIQDWNKSDIAYYMSHSLQLLKATKRDVSNGTVTRVTPG